MACSVPASRPGAGRASGKLRKTPEGNQHHDLSPRLLAHGNDRISVASLSGRRLDRHRIGGDQTCWVLEAASAARFRPAEMRVAERPCSLAERGRPDHPLATRTRQEVQSAAPTWVRRGGVQGGLHHAGDPTAPCRACKPACGQRPDRRTCLGPLALSDASPVGPGYETPHADLLGEGRAVWAAGAKADHRGSRFRAPAGGASGHGSPRARRRSGVPDRAAWRAGRRC
jgi:hypothetical protein